MAFGDVRGTLSVNVASITNPLAATGSVVVSQGDLIYGVFVEQIALTVTTVTDNLGNTYTACNAGTLSGAAVSGRAYYSIVNKPGTLTSVSAVTTASTNNAVFVVGVYQGPFIGIDKNPANITSDITTPYNCPTTGTLAQKNEVVIGWGAANYGTVWTATSPNLLTIDQASVAVVKAALGSQVVAATTAVVPVFAAAGNPANDVLGTSSFKGMPEGASIFEQQNFPVRWFLRARDPYPSKASQSGVQSAIISIDPRYQPPSSYWPNPYSNDPPSDWISYTLPLNAVVVVQPPFYQTEWPNPRGIRSNPDYVDNTNIWLIGQDKIAFRQTDWPVPTGAQRPSDISNWTFSSAISLLTFVAPGPFSQDDWPIPKGAARSIDLLTLIDQSLALFAKPFAQTNWPNPRGYPPTPQDLIRQVQIRLIGQDFLPFRQSEWPVPKGYQPTAGWIYRDLTLLTAPVAPPFYQTQWDNPRGYQQPVRDWLWVVQTQLIGQDSLPIRQQSWPVPTGYAPLNRGWENTLRLVITSKPFSQNEWVNPPGALRALELNSWFVERSIALLSAVVFDPRKQLDWPNPRGYVPSIDLRTFTNSVKIQLIGKDLLPFRNQWVNPPGYVPAISLRSWTESTKRLLIGKDRLPFRWLENPNPSLGKPYPSSIRTFDAHRQLTAVVFTTAYSFGYITG